MRSFPQMSEITPQNEAAHQKKMANKEKQMTEVEALALCLVRQLGGDSFGQKEAEAACNTLAMLFENKRVDAATFARVNSRLGNHSAIRQWGIKMGLITAKDAARDAVAKEVDRLKTLESAELDSMV